MMDMQKAFEIEFKRIVTEVIESRHAAWQRWIGNNPPEDEDVMSYIAATIREVRQSERLTQEELAELCGLGRTSIVNIESGFQQTPIRNLLLIARALKVHISDLFPPKPNAQ